MNTTKLMLRGKATLLPFIPKDKGNLARQLRVYKTPRGFRYVLLGNGAPYNVVVNRGRRDRPLSDKERENVNYWGRGAEALKTLIFTNQNSEFDSYSYQEAVRKTKRTVANETLFERSIPKVGG